MGEGKSVLAQDGKRQYTSCVALESHRTRGSASVLGKQLKPSEFPGSKKSSLGPGPLPGAPGKRARDGQAQAQQDPCGGLRRIVDAATTTIATRAAPVATRAAAGAGISTTATTGAAAARAATAGAGVSTTAAA